MSWIPGRLYFAYGSNLWLQQMARRCPDSFFVGRAILPDHVWQINERGFANVVPRSGYNVHGLVYQVNAENEARLDRFEGTHSGAYSKTYKSVILHLAQPEFQISTRWIVENDGIANSTSLAGQWFWRNPPVHQEARLQANVLVYLSEDFVQWGESRADYSNRMNHGISDAIALGVPADFYEHSVRSMIPAPRIPPRTFRLSHHNNTTYSRRPYRYRRESSSPEDRGRRISRRKSRGESGDFPRNASPKLRSQQNGAHRTIFSRSLSPRGRRVFSWR